MMLKVLALLLLAAPTPAPPQDLFEQFGDGKKKKQEKATVTVEAIRPEKTDVKVGEVFNVAFDLSITEGWYIYPAAGTTTGQPTGFEFEGAKAAGKVVEPKPKFKPKENEFVDAYEYQDGKVTMAVPVRLDAGPKPGPLTVTGKVVYQICSDVCIPAETAFTFDVTVLEGSVAASAGAGSSSSIVVMLVLAFIGGLILNIMPCVLPVLTLKLFSLVKQKDISGGERRMAALSYTAGVLLCLNAFALAVVLLQSFGNQVGWGFQFQEPMFVIVLATIVFVFALSLLGVFELPTPSGGSGKGHLVSGFFVTLIATPCSAPFLGSALGFAFTLPPWGIFLFFSVAALGLASPFLLIGFVPALLRFLPKPGAWVEVFKKVMGFALIATSVWLMDVIASLTGQAGLVGFLAFLTFASIAAWVFGKWGSPVSSTKSKWISLAVAALLIVVGGKWWLVTEIPDEPPPSTELVMDGLKFDEKIPWQPFSDENVDKVRAAGRPGFIDFTADW